MSPRDYLCVCVPFCSKLNGGQAQVCILFLRKIKQAAFIDLLGVEMNIASSYPTLPCLFFFFFKVWSCAFEVSTVLYDQAPKHNLKVLVASEPDKLQLHISISPDFPLGFPLVPPLSLLVT